MDKRRVSLGGTVHPSNVIHDLETEVTTLRAQLADAQVDILALTTADKEWVCKMETAERRCTTIEQIAQGLADALRGAWAELRISDPCKALAAFAAYQKAKGK